MAFPGKAPNTTKRLIKGQWSGMGHWFDEKMRCERCNRSFQAHQNRPRVCKGTPRTKAPQ